MDLGMLDVCLTIRDVQASIAFYEKLGFKIVEGNPQEGWTVMKQRGCRIGLYEPRACGGKLGEISLNFRGGNVSSLVEQARAAGLEPTDVQLASTDGPGSASIRDPDGFHVFLDTAPGEEPQWD